MSWWVTLTGGLFEGGDAHLRVCAVSGEDRRHQHCHMSLCVQSLLYKKVHFHLNIFRNIWEAFPLRIERSNENF